MIIDMQDTYVRMGIGVVGGVTGLFLFGLCVIGGHKVWYLGNRLKQVLRI